MADARAPFSDAGACGGMTLEGYNQGLSRINPYA